MYVYISIETFSTYLYFYIVFIDTLNIILE